MNVIAAVRCQNEILYAALEEGKAQYLIRSEEQDLSRKGQIFLGRVDHVVPNIRAAFVRFDKDHTGFLPYHEILPACVLNRELHRGEAPKQGDEIIVQIAHDKVKTKEEVLTCMLSLAGETCAVSLSGTGVGCSKKLPDELRSILIRSFHKSCRARGHQQQFGVVLRTEAAQAVAGIETSDNPLEMFEPVFEEYLILAEQMAEILSAARTRTLFSTLYMPGMNRNMEEKLLQLIHFEQLRGGSIGRIVTDVPKVMEAATKLMEGRREAGKPELVLEETEAGALAKRLGLSDLVSSLSRERIVWLRSGAYLVIEKTEAMNVVDVNTGKAIAGKKTEPEAHFLKINCEAAEEVLRQIRLRDLTGMILVDFINMKLETSNQELIRVLQEGCAQDPLGSRFVDLTGLGIAEIVRSKR